MPALRLLQLRAAPLAASQPAPLRPLRARRQVSAATDPSSAAADPLSDASRGPFKGTFGEWNIEPADALEVWSYRGCLAVVAATFCAGTLGAMGPAEAPWAAALAAAGTPLAAAGGLSLGAATVLIHVYVDPLKRFLQACLAAGVAGGTYLAAAHPDIPLPAYVAAHPSAVWLIGPAFASLTGIAVKEGFCFGRAESAGLALLTPVLLLGHLSGVLPVEAEQKLAAVLALLMAVFAARKFGQPVKDDIGDKSVFEFYKLSEAEQQAKVAQLQRQKASDQQLPGGNDE